MSLCPPLLGTALAALPLLAAVPGEADPIDILGLVTLDDLVETIPYDVETFDFGAPILHFDDGTSISLDDAGQIERIDAPYDGWSCRTERFFLVAATVHACPESVDAAQHQAFVEAETIVRASYAGFLDSVEVSTGWTGLERRFELRALGLAHRSPLACRFWDVDHFQARGEFTTPAGVEALRAATVDAPLHVAPFPFEQCFEARP